MSQLTWNEWWSPVWLSVKISAAASLLVFLLGLLAAWGMTRSRFRGKSLLDTLFLLPLVLPPTVVGFLLLLLVGRQSVIGRFAEWALGHTLVFTWWAAVIAAVVMSFPLVYQTAKTGFASVDQELEASARSIGANEWQVLRYITLPLCKSALASAFLLGFARSLGEFGATFMVAGSIPGQTQTMPTAIYQAVESGQLPPAAYWTVAIMALSFFMLRAVGRTPRESS